MKNAPGKPLLSILKISVRPGGKEGARLTCLVRNDLPVEVPPVRIRLEFHDTRGRMFQSTSVTLPALAPSATAERSRHVTLRSDEFFRWSARFESAPGVDYADFGLRNTLAK
ncbi:MAG: hypothetical protein AB1742_08250 [bacterium]